MATGSKATAYLTVEDQSGPGIAKFQANIRRAGESVAGLRGALGTLGVGVSLGGLISVGKAAIDAVAALDDLAEKTSLSVELLDQLGQVATIGGHSLDDVARLASIFAKNVALAAGGNEELLKSFKELGFTQEQLRRQSFDETFVQFAKAIATAENATNALARGQAVAGKALAQNVPFLRDLAEEGLRGARVTAEQAAAAEKFQKSVNRLGLAIDDLKVALATDLVVQLNRVGDAMAEAAKQGGLLSAVWEGLVTSLSEAFGSKAANELGRVVTQLEGAERALKNLNEQAQASSRPSAFAGAIAQQEAQVARLRAERARLQALVDIETPGRVFAPEKAPPKKRVAEETGTGSGAAARGADPFEQRRQALAQELQRSRELTAVEELLEDLQTGRLAKVTAAQRDVLIGLAAQVDLAKEDARVQKEASEIADRAAKAQAEAIARENERLEQAAARWRAIIDPTEEYRRKIEEIAELVNRGKLTPEEGDILVEREAIKINEALIVVGETAKETNDIARELGLTFSSAFEDAVIEGKNFSDVLKGIEQDLLRLGTRKLVTEPLLKEFEGLLGQATGGGGLGDLFGGIGNFVKGLFGFQQGGSFTVGGSGGSDSQLVAFRATPGERVTVTPAGQAGGAVSVVNHFVISGAVDARSQEQIALQVGRAVGRATRRSG